MIEVDVTGGEVQIAAIADVVVAGSEIEGTVIGDQVEVEIGTGVVEEVEVEVGIESEFFFLYRTKF